MAISGEGLGRLDGTWLAGPVRPKGVILGVRAGWWARVPRHACADDGKGGDITRNGAPLKTYEEWINS